MEDRYVCSLCGNDEVTARIARRLGLRPDVAFMKLRTAVKLLNKVLLVADDYDPEFQLSLLEDEVKEFLKSIGELKC